MSGTSDKILYFRQILYMFNVCMWVLYAPNSSIVCVYLSASVKSRFIIEHDAFCKSVIICNSISNLATKCHTFALVIAGPVTAVTCTAS